MSTVSSALSLYSRSLRDVGSLQNTPKQVRATTADPAVREQELARRLDERLSAHLAAIRSSITPSEDAPQGFPAVGGILDIRA